MVQNEYKFLKKPDFARIRDQFSNELEQAAKGDKNQLLFLKTYLPQKPIIASGTIQVAVIGGTNYDFAVIEIDEQGTKKIQFREKGKLPPINSYDAFTILNDSSNSFVFS